MDLSPSKMRFPFSSETMRRDRLPCPPPPSPEIKRPSDEKGLSLEDFLVNLVPPDNQVGTCIRRSDGRIYAIKKVLQTQQTWTELAILDRIKRIRNSFCPLLHWTFERGHYIYLIMVCTAWSIIGISKNMLLGQLPRWHSYGCHRTVWNVWSVGCLFLCMWNSMFAVFAYVPLYHSLLMTWILDNGTTIPAWCRDRAS